MALKAIKKWKNQFSTFLTVINVILYITESDFFFFESCYFIVICIIIILFFVNVVLL